MSVPAIMPGTGEVLDLRGAPTDELADWRLRTIEVRRELKALSDELDIELARRIDFECAGRTVRVGDFKLTVESPLVTEWDIERLGIALEALVNEGRIARPVAERSFRVKVTREPDVVHLKRLLAHADPEVRESIERCRSTVERKPRPVTVRLAHTK